MSRNIAIFSPNKNPYSETFIQAHKNLLPGNIYYYYGRDKNIKLENGNLDLRKRSLIFKLKAKFIKSHAISHKWDLLRKSLMENNIDIILIQYGNHAHELLPFLNDIDIPFVVHFHGYDAVSKKVIEQCGNYKDLFARASACIAVSKVMQTKLLKLNCPEHKLYYNVYGPNDIFLDITATLEKQTLIGIGRFTDKKAPYLTLFAFAKALKQVPDAQLIMAGDGILLNSCINIADHLGITNKVTFPGIITPEQYANHLKDTRAFVQHSITSMSGDMEGTPLAILEAAAAGLPVISTYHAGIPDVIIHQETGLLGDEMAVDVMADHMITLLTDKELAKKMGQASKENIKKNFTMNRHISALNGILEKYVTSDV